MMDRYENPQVQHVTSHFLDSGSFTLRSKAIQFGLDNKCSQWEYYETDDFWKYMDAYATFVQTYKAAIDLYANVDVIPNAELTWRNQQHLESKGLSPVPVVHFGTDVNGVQTYIDRGYKVIALGSLVGQAKNPDARQWLDSAFRIVCNTTDNTPKVKVHGFGVTSLPLLYRYPWWSVDSTTWTKIGAYGGILVPNRSEGVFLFGKGHKVSVVKTSFESPDIKKKMTHFDTAGPTKQKRVLDWLELIDVPLGETKKHVSAFVFGQAPTIEYEVVTQGVRTRHTERREANLKFFERLRDSMPRWPQPFKKKLPKMRDGELERGIKKGYLAKLGKPTKPKNFKPRKIKIYYSGEAAKANPELVLKQSNLMLTYFKSCGKTPEIRFVRLHEKRLKELKKRNK